jgi:hypothetical protein
LRTIPFRRSSIKEQGKGSMGCPFSLLLLVGLGYLGYKFVPHYVNHFQLKDAMTGIAVSSAAGTDGRLQGVKGIQDAVLAKAIDLQIPLKREDITVRNEGEKVFITVGYTVPVSLPNRVYDLKFEFTGHN